MKDVITVNANMGMYVPYDSCNTYEQGEKLLLCCGVRLARAREREYFIKRSVHQQFTLVRGKAKFRSLSGKYFATTFIV